MSPPEVEALRCSPLTREAGFAPIGTAQGGASLLVIDLALPWPSEIECDPRLAACRAAVASETAAGRRWRIQATVPDERRSTSSTITAYRFPDDAFLRFAPRRVRVEGDQADRVGAALIRGEIPSSDLALDFDGFSSELDFRPDDDDDGSPASHDFLICTHGRRDVCCGSSGTDLWQSLTGRSGDRRESAARATSHETKPIDKSPVHFARTSHTGGHRFASTAIDLPSGTSWAWLDETIVKQIVQRTGPVENLLAHYRGSMAFAQPAAQVVEAEVFKRIGWDWLSYHRRATVEQIDNSEFVTLAWSDPTGASGQAEGTVEKIGFTPVAICGQPLEQAQKFSPLQRLSAFRFLG